VFTGEYRHTVDDKGRLAVPSRFRAQLDGGSVISRWIDGCLAIHTRAGWADLEAKIAALPLTDANARLFQRSIFAGAADAELDKQGRVLLPAYLREGIGLGSDAIVLGARDHAEIWAPATWATYRRAMDDPEAFAQAIQGLGI
jgi:MraZ protein